MPPSPISSKSKRNARHAQRATPVKRTSSESTSSSADSSEFAAQSSDDEFERASPASSIEYQPEELDEPLTWAFKVRGHLPTLPCICLVAEVWHAYTRGAERRSGVDQD